MNDSYESFEALYIDLALAIALVKIRYPDRLDDIRALLQDTGWVRPDLRIVQNDPRDCGQFQTNLT